MKTPKRPAKSAKAKKASSRRQPPSGHKFTLRNGVPVLASRGEVITEEHIRKLRDELGV